VKINRTKIASVLAFIIGAMAIFAGGQTLLGRDPGYYVINWLLLYNYTLGILTVFVTAILIWTGSRFARVTATGTFALHVLVMLILLLAYRTVVAPDSLVAMTVRIVIWGIILGLLWIPVRRSSHA
jgi:hypothetical protein